MPKVQVLPGGINWHLAQSAQNAPAGNRVSLPSRWNCVYGNRDVALLLRTSINVLLMHGLSTAVHVNVMPGVTYNIWESNYFTARPDSLIQFPKYKVEDCKILDCSFCKFNLILNITIQIRETESVNYFPLRRSLYLKFFSNLVIITPGVFSIPNVGYSRFTAHQCILGWLDSSIWALKLQLCVWQ